MEQPTSVSEGGSDPAVTEALDPDYGHAVIIHIGPANPEIALMDIEDPLIRAVEVSRAGIYDGNFFDGHESLIYFYGPDADRLYAAMRAALRRAPLPPGSYLIKQYGDPGAREVRVDLR